jgi:hypothetical protein
MALPAVAALVAKLAATPAAQSAVIKVAGDVYGRIMTPAKSETGAHGASLDTVARRLDEMATREELVASFAALQAELDRRHQRTNILVAAVIALQAILLVALLLL